MSQGKGRRSRGHFYNKNKINVGDKGREILENIDENNPVILQFRSYASELDEKHDRFERLVKTGRDVTIESKRIIFLLHSIDKESKKDSVLAEAKARLENLEKTLFKSIALELQNEDFYQYQRAYRAGVEEYIEAITFYQYLQNGNMQDWMELEKSLIYTVLDKTKAISDNNSVPMKNIEMLIFPNEYILGIADLTGELMRKCINNLATGDIASCYQTCNFVRNMYKGFLGCSSSAGKEVYKKLYTLKQSLAKMENVCYTIKVRGSEIPKHRLADVAIVATEEYNADDEGYQGY
ncbi:translin-associated protein X [Prorops nasuta]|uniref:translin-associated protein X n=1 Tax=Prorops nasuta TaxID=863751 RepID=UPI0034CF98DC